MLHGWCWKRGTTVTVNIIKQQFIAVPARYSSSLVNGEENSTRYIPSAASQVFENMDDRDKYALINRISMPFSEPDLSRISTYVKTDFKVNNIMTLRKRLFQYSELWVPMDGNALQVLYSCLFRQRQFKLLLSFHQYLLKRDGHVDMSLPVADMLMTSAVLERKVQFAGTVWQTVPDSWRHSPRLYCSFAMMLFSKRLGEDAMKIIQSNCYDSSGYRDASQNWKLLKGLEIAGHYNKCLELADSMCEKAKSNSPILHSMAMDSLIGSLCKLQQFKQVEEYYRTAIKNNLRIEETTFDKIIKLQLTNDIWKTVYEDEKEKARENGLSLSPEDDQYLKWQAKSYFYDRSEYFFFEKNRKIHARFFFFDDSLIRLEQRKTSLTQLQLMLYILLESPPAYFTAEVKPEQILLINKHKDLETISVFLKNVIYPPLEGINVVDDTIQIPVECIMKRREEVAAIQERLRPAFLTRQEFKEIMGFN